MKYRSKIIKFHEKFSLKLKRRKIQKFFQKNKNIYYKPL